jgi:glycogen debranching enzyme
MVQPTMKPAPASVRKSLRVVIRPPTPSGTRIAASPFGRDSLIVSLQNILIYPHFARGALDFLGSRQAKENDPYRDAEPGKIFHELRRGELAHFKLVPHTPYYGTADATPLYLITLHATWRCDRR